VTAAAILSLRLTVAASATPGPGRDSESARPGCHGSPAGDCGNRGDLTRWKPEHWQLRFRARDHHDLLGRRPAVAASAAAVRPGGPGRHPTHGAASTVLGPGCRRRRRPRRGRPGPGTGTGTCQCRGYLGSPPEATSVIAAAASLEFKLRVRARPGPTATRRTWRLRLTAGLRVRIRVTSQSPWPGRRADCRRHGPQLRQSGLGDS
jgi:hypothetical protein